MATAKAAPEGAGDVWTWTALDADTKLIESYYVGDRSGESAMVLMDDLRTRLAASPIGGLIASPPKLTKVPAQRGERRKPYFDWLDSCRCFPRALCGSWGGSQSASKTM